MAFRPPSSIGLCKTLLDGFLFHKSCLKQVLSCLKNVGLKWVTFGITINTLADFTKTFNEGTTQMYVAVITILCQNTSIEKKKGPVEYALFIHKLYISSLFPNHSSKTMHA